MWYAMREMAARGAGELATMRRVHGLPAVVLLVSLPWLQLSTACDGSALPGETEDGPDAALVPDFEGPIFQETPLAIPENGESCFAESHQARAIPVDIALMLDTSGSMAAPVGMSALTKWEAVRTAIRSFLFDARTQDVEIGLQYFPIPLADVPGECSSHAQCGAAAPCSITTCRDSFNVCVTDEDCPGEDEPCVPFGGCAVTGALCLGDGAQECASGEECLHVPTGICINSGVCSAEDYAIPEVEIAPVEDVRERLEDSLQEREPDGNTPTAPALRGLIDWGRRNSIDNPHKTIAVLATDGLPTSCDTIEVPEVAQIASDGFTGSPSISTYVVGVANAEEIELQDNLRQLAAAGGTEEPILIDQTVDLTQAFLEALFQIRQAALECIFELPAPVSTRLEYDKVNVEFRTPLSVPAVLYYVGEYDNCSTEKGGWYYDVDPEQGESPRRILLCDNVCGQLRAVTQARVDLKVGCQRRDLR